MEELSAKIDKPGHANSKTTNVENDPEKQVEFVVLITYKRLMNTNSWQANDFYYISEFKHTQTKRL